MPLVHEVSTGDLRMKKISLTAALAPVILIPLVLIRTVGFTSRQVRVDPVGQIAIDRKQTAERLAKAIQFRTISYEDPARINGKEFLRFHQYLEQAFPNAHAALTKEVVGDYSLLYTWKGEAEELKPILLMGHMDVVPVEPGTENGWTYPPFAGRIADGYIWGRGAMDDKVNVLGILEAVELLLEKGFQPRRTVYLAFGHDEEVRGALGAANIAALLHSRGVKLEYILDEGGVITDGKLLGVPRPVALVGIAEKGYLSIELTAESQGGHSSIPPRETAVGTLSTAIHNLERNQFPGRINGATEKLLEYVGPEMPFTRRMVFANLWLFGWLVERQLARSPLTNALIRTTTAATMFKGSIKENVLPAEARAVVNFRILPGDSINGVIDHVRRTINDTRITVTPLNLSSEPSSVSDIESSSFKTLQKTIHQVSPDVVVAPWLLVAGTDSIHYAKLSDNIYRFVPIRVGREDARRLHGTDERISIQDYEQCVRFLIQLIRNS